MSERHKNEVWVRMLNENVDDLVKYVLKYIDEEKSN